MHLRTSAPAHYSKSVMSRWLIGLGILAGLVMGIGGYTFIYAKGASYLTDDPAACANCHVMSDYYTQW